MIICVPGYGNHLHQGDSIHDSPMNEQISIEFILYWPLKSYL